MRTNRFRNLLKGRRRSLVHPTSPFVVLTLLLAPLGSVDGRTWHVPGDVPTLTEALGDSAEYGDTVLVAPGTYSPATGETFPLDMVNGVALIGEAGKGGDIVPTRSLS